MTGPQSDFELASRTLAFDIRFSRRSLALFLSLLFPHSMFLSFPFIFFVSEEKKNTRKQIFFFFFSMTCKFVYTTAVSFSSVLCRLHDKTIIEKEGIVIFSHFQWINVLV